MTDETREQIKRDASKVLYHPESEYFRQGATHQHPIAFEAGKKEGWNEAIEAAIKAVRSRMTLSVSTTNSIHNNALSDTIKILKDMKNETT